MSLKTVQDQREKNKELVKWESQGAKVTEYYVGEYHGEPVSIWTVDFRFEEEYRDHQVQIWSDITWSPLVELINGNISWSSGPGAFAPITTNVITDVMIEVMKIAKEIGKEYNV